MQSPERKDDSKWTCLVILILEPFTYYCSGELLDISLPFTPSGSVTSTIAKPKINSTTAIVRSFFENMSRKSKSSGNHLQHSAELEESGFQVEDSQD